MGPCTFWAPVLPRNCPVLIRMRVVSQGKRLTVPVVMFNEEGNCFPVWGWDLERYWAFPNITRCLQPWPVQWEVSEIPGSSCKIQLSFPDSFPALNHHSGSAQLFCGASHMGCRHYLCRISSSSSGINNCVAFTKHPSRMRANFRCVSQ